MGKIKVKKTGDWWPGKSSKEYKDNYDTMQWDHDAPEGEGAALERSQSNRILKHFVDKAGCA